MTCLYRISQDRVIDVTFGFPSAKRDGTFEHPVICHLPLSRSRMTFEALRRLYRWVGPKGDYTSHTFFEL